MKKYFLIPILIVFLFAGQVFASQWIAIQGPVLLDVDYQINSVNKHSTAGVLNFDFDFQSGGIFERNAYGFCIEPNAIANSGYADIVSLDSYSATSSIGVEKFQKAAWLIDNYWDSNNSSVQNAGLQLAVWDAIYDFQLLPSTASSISNWYTSYTDGLSQLYDTSYTGENYRIVDFADNQDMIIRTVPLPATVLLMGLGLVGISSARRKKIFKA